MQLTKMHLKFKTYQHEVPVPLICPYCGRAVELSEQSSTSIIYNDNKELFLKTLYLKCCDKSLAALYTYEEDGFRRYIDLIFTYPSTSDIHLPESLLQISPDFVKLYKDSTFAYENNLNSLAAMGFRKSLEVLIKDYAINVLKKPKEEVIKKKLINAISDYMPMQELIKTADVVRILGNDHTHYYQKYSQYDIEVLIKYLDIFIQLIDTKYLIDHPPVSR